MSRRARDIVDVLSKPLSYTIQRVAPQVSYECVYVPKMNIQLNITTFAHLHILKFYSYIAVGIVSVLLLFLLASWYCWILNNCVSLLRYTVISQVACVRGWWGRVDNRRWVIPSVITIQSSYESKKGQLQAQTSLEALKDVSLTLSIFQTHTSHVVLSMGPIVSVVTIHGQQNSLKKSGPVS